jgi:hypothetical protein
MIEAAEPAETGIADELLDSPEEIEVIKDVKEDAPVKEEKEKERFVPHAALHEERERRKELQQELKQRAEAEKRLEERLNKLNEALFTPRQEEQYQDPVEKLAREIQELKQGTQQERQQKESESKQQQEHAKFVNKYAASAEAFAKDKPDFGDAYKFLLSARAEELRLMGLPPQEVNKSLVNEEMFIANRAYQDERNPAEVLYELARKRGYTGEKPKTDSKIEQLDKGLKAKSLGSGGGKPEGGGLDIAHLRDMSDEEFEQTWKTFEKQAKR